MNKELEPRKFKVKVYYSKEISCEELEIDADNYIDAEHKALIQFTNKNNYRVWAIRAK